MTTITSEVAPNIDNDSVLADNKVVMVTTCALVAVLIPESSLRDRTLAMSVSPISTISSEDISTAPKFENFLTELDKSLKSSIANQDFPAVDRAFDTLRNRLGDSRGLGSIEVIESGMSVLKAELNIFDLEKISVLKDVSQSLGSLFDRNVKNNSQLPAGLIQELGRPSWRTLFSDPGFTPTFQGPDMNSMQFIEPIAWKDKNPYDQYIFNLGPGTMFLPEDDDYQPMVSYRPVVFDYKLRFNLFASAKPQSNPTASTRTLCLAMNKKPPVMGVKYFPVPVSNPVVRGLAVLSSLSRSTGAQDQARMWLYADKAGLAEINKRLIPGIVPGYYTRALRDIEKLGGFTDKDRKNKLIYPTELLFAPSGDAHAFQNYISNVAQNFPKETRTALEKGHNEQVNALFSINATELKNEHLNFMLSSILTSNNNDVKMGMLAFLEKRVPSGSRATIRSLSNFRVLEELATSSDEKIASSAKKTLATFE